MTEVVLDASVVIKWFRRDGEGRTREAAALREAFLAGELEVVVPALLYLEILNAAGRRWRWGQAALLELASGLEALRFDEREPSWAAVARWVSQGLTAYDAAYVAVAEEFGIALVTDDALILAVAPAVAQPLAER